MELTLGIYEKKLAKALGHGFLRCNNIVHVNPKVHNRGSTCTKVVKGVLFTAGDTVSGDRSGEACERIPPVTGKEFGSP